MRNLPGSTYVVYERFKYIYIYINNINVRDGNICFGIYVCDMKTHLETRLVIYRR